MKNKCILHIMTTKDRLFVKHMCETAFLAVNLFMGNKCVASVTFMWPDLQVFMTAGAKA